MRTVSAERIHDGHIFINSTKKTRNWTIKRASWAKSRRRDTARPCGSLWGVKMIMRIRRICLARMSILSRINRSNILTWSRMTQLSLKRRAKSLSSSRMMTKSINHHNHLPGSLLVRSRSSRVNINWLRENPMTRMSMPRRTVKQLGEDYRNDSQCKTERYFLKLLNFRNFSRFSQLI